MTLKELDAIIADAKKKDDRIAELEALLASKEDIMKQAKRWEHWEVIGNNDLRMDATGAGGFRHVVLRDADDGDTIVVNEDDLIALRDRLTRIIEEMSMGSSGLPVAVTLLNLPNMRTYDELNMSQPVEFCQHHTNRAKCHACCIADRDHAQERVAILERLLSRKNAALDALAHWGQRPLGNPPKSVVDFAAAERDVTI